MLIKREAVHQPKLPNGAYKYKVKNNKTIYKNRYVDEYYMIYSSGNGRYIVEQYKGECHC